MNRTPMNRDLSGRVREVREELYGEDGVPKIAEALDIPPRTWFNYESGVTIPAPVILAFIGVTNADPAMAAERQGRKFAGARFSHAQVDSEGGLTRPVVHGDGEPAEPRQVRQQGTLLLADLVGVADQHQGFAAPPPALAVVEHAPRVRQPAVAQAEVAEEGSHLRDPFGPLAGQAQQPGDVAGAPGHLPDAQVAGEVEPVPGGEGDLGLEDGAGRSHVQDSRGGRVRSGPAGTGGRGRPPLPSRETPGRFPSQGASPPAPPGGPKKGWPARNTVPPGLPTSAAPAARPRPAEGRRPVSRHPWRGDPGPAMMGAARPRNGSVRQLS